MQDCSEALVYGDYRHMDDRSECEDIRDSREILDIYIYIYIFILSF